MKLLILSNSSDSKLSYLVSIINLSMLYGRPYAKALSFLGISLDDLGRDCHELRVRGLITLSQESNLTFNRFLR